MDDAGGIAVPEHLVPALLEWFKNPTILYGPPVQWVTTYHEEKIMKQVHVDVCLNIGLMPDESVNTVQDVLNLIEILPMESMEPRPIHVTFTDVDTGLITSEKIFCRKGDPK